MYKKIWGLILIICGAISTIYGIDYDNSAKSQLHNGVSDFVNGVAGNEVLARDNKGMVFIVIGIVLIIVGIILIATSEAQQKTIMSRDDSNDANSYVEYDDKISDDANSYDNTDYAENYEQVIDNINKIYNLYKNEIYDKKDYDSKKNKWIESLKALGSVNEEDFLNDILPLIKEKALTSEDVDNIKYIISGKYAIDKGKQERERFQKLREQAERERQQVERERQQAERERKELEREKKEAIRKAVNDKISNIKVSATSFFNKICDFMRNDLNSTTRKMFIGGIGILIFIIVFLVVGSTISSPKRAVITFENAANKNDAKKLCKILYSSDERLKLTPDDTEPLLQAFKTEPSEFTEVINDLNNQVSNIKSNKNGDNTSNLYVAKVGRTLLIFPKYKIVVKPVFLTITSSVKGSDILINDKKIAKVDNKNFSKQLGPFIPGIYDVEGKANGDFGEMDNKVKVDFIEDKKESEAVNALKGLYLQAISDYSNNEVYINGKDTGKSINSGDKIGPVASGAKVYAVIDYNGKKVKSAVSTLSDNSSTINFDYSKQGQNSEQQKNDINNMVTGYAASLADALTSGNTSQLVNYMYPGSKIYSDQMYNVNTYYRGNNNFYEKYDSAVVNSCKMDPDGKSGTINTTEVFDINEHNNEFGSRLSTRTFENVYKFKYNDTAKAYQLIERTSAVEK